MGNNTSNSSGAAQHYREFLSPGVSSLLKDLKNERAVQLDALRHSTLDLDHPFHKVIRSLSRLAPESMERPFSIKRPLNLEEIISFQEEIQDHTMNHPVWSHPFLESFSSGDISPDAFRLFAPHFFNYVKNTSQTVALSIGKFYSLTPGHYGLLSERISELTRLVLSQSLTDEFSINHRNRDRNFEVMRLLNPHTNSSSYRQFLDKLNIPFPDQDIRLSHGMADTVIIMRLLAGSESFTELESLTSIGVNEIWGVSEFYSVILKGIKNFSEKQNTAFSENELEIFRNHSVYDLNYSLAFMLTAALHFHNDHPLVSVKNVINIVMASRYAMLSDLNRIVFDKESPRLYEHESHKQYLVGDRRIENELIIARQKLVEDTVININEYKDKKATPFVFKDI
jgi:hypothetical protein